MKMVPHGFRFNPTDEELIEILDRKASGQEMPLDFIIHLNIYENEPQHLQWNESSGVIGKGERYYYCKKENDSREVTGKGWWKATSHVKKVFVNQNLVGCRRPLTFHKYKDHHTSRSNAIKTNWIMHEFSLHSKTTEWRLCKIKHKGKPSVQEEMESIRQRFSSSSNDFEAGNSTNIISQSISTNGEQEIEGDDNTFAAVNSTMPTDNNSYANHYDVAATIDSSDYYFTQQFLEPFEDQFPIIWSWQN